ncbi:MAG: nitroreductase family deazaflavin-dependent oxidoreductase [Anaerolineae bacterium]|nr:nitroreductase family deazaflavin-dependent oxidoreductase [Anaerolineae bacterium]
MTQFNKLIAAIINSPLHGLLGPSFALITVIGRKSAQPVSPPINLVHFDEAYWVTSLKKRTWWRNLRGGAIAELHVAGKTFSALAQVIEDPEPLAQAFRRYFQTNPNLAKTFSVKFLGTGDVDPTDWQTLLNERVMIQLSPLHKDM